MPHHCSWTPQDATRVPPVSICTGCAAQGVSNGYPGGKIFDFMGLSRGSPEKFEKYKWNEVRNGRLAMVAFLGFAAQFAATGKGPIENLVSLRVACVVDNELPRLFVWV